MRNNPTKKWLYIIAFLFVTGGFLIPFWPLEVVGIATAAFTGSGFVAPALGLLLDLAYGSPTGMLHYLYFPFTLGGFLILIVRYVGIRFALERSWGNRL